MKHLTFEEIPTDAICGSTNKNLLASGGKNRTNPDLATFSEFRKLVANNEQVCKKCLKRFIEVSEKRAEREFNNNKGIK